MGRERWVWGLGAVAVAAAALLGAFWLAIHEAGGTADPAALFAGLTGSLAGIVGAYFSVAAGGSGLQAASEARAAEANAFGAMAHMARLMPAPQTDQEKAAAAEAAITSVTSKLPDR
jgi:hypothetical protein